MEATIVDSVASEPAVTLPPDASAREAAERMAASEVGSVLVVEDGELAGIATERDLARLLADGGDPDETRLDAIMSAPVETVRPAANVEEAIEAMVEAGVRRLAVELEGELRGVVSVTDVAYAEPELARRARENLGKRWKD